MSHRAQRVADLIRDELARLLREEVRDPAVGFVTLTEVQLSPDLKHARVYLSVLDRDAQATLSALRRATPFLRRSLARHAGLRYTPQLRFLIDESVATGFRVERLLADQTEPPDDQESDDRAEDGGTADR